MKHTCKDLRCGDLIRWNETSYVKTDIVILNIDYQNNYTYLCVTCKHRSELVGKIYTSQLCHSHENWECEFSNVTILSRMSLLES